MARRRPDWPLWRQVTVSGSVLALGALGLEWLDYRRLGPDRTGDIALFVGAVGFLLLGIWVGARLFGETRTPAVEGNPQAQAALGISGRELEVLRLLAAGGSNKDIARTLGLSPNTVKTHAARLYEKLDAARRTEAVARARALGLIG